MKKFLLKSITKLFGGKVLLSSAILHNNIEDVKIAVEMKNDLNYHSLYGGQSFIYPLMTSVYYGRRDICSILLKSRANPNLKYRACIDRNIGDFDDHTDYNGDYSEYFWKDFVPFFDPKCRISNSQEPPKREFDKTGWKKITPTVLAFVLGEYDILEQCLAKGGRLCTAFDGEYYSFIWYFLEHPTTCHSSICELLIKYREFSVTDFEQKAFQNFCDKLELMRRHVQLSDELSRDLEKIIFMLMSYGFRRRDGETQFFFYYDGHTSSSSSSSASSTTSSEGDGERFFPFRSSQSSKTENQQQHQQNKNDESTTTKGGDSAHPSGSSCPSQKGKACPSHEDLLACDYFSSTSNSSITIIPCSPKEAKKSFFESLSSMSSSSSRESSPKKVSRYHKKELSHRRVLIKRMKVGSREAREREENLIREEQEQKSEYSFSFYTSRVTSEGCLEKSAIRRTMEIR